MNNTDMFFDQLSINLKHFDEVFVHLIYHINGMYACIFGILVAILGMFILVDVYICCVLICGVDLWAHRKLKIDLKKKEEEMKLVWEYKEKEKEKKLKLEKKEKKKN